MTDTDVGLSESLNSVTSSLLEGVKAGKSEAWDRLSRMYTPLVYWWCRRSGCDEHASADVGQAVFLSLFSNVEKCRRESFRGYLWTITKSKIKDHWRIPANRKSVPVDLEQVSLDDHLEYSRSPSDEVRIIYRQVVDFIRGEFSETDWRVFIGYVCDEKPAKQVAEEQGVSQNVVYLVKSRITRRVREEFEL